MDVHCKACSQKGIKVTDTFVQDKSVRHLYSTESAYLVNLPKCGTLKLKQGNALLEVHNR